MASDIGIGSYMADAMGTELILDQAALLGLVSDLVIEMQKLGYEK